MIHLESVALRSSSRDESRGYPFNVPAVAHLDELRFHTPVTFLVGENGSGKSTLMEAIALAANAVAVGSDEVSRDETLVAVRKLARQLKLTWNRRTHKGFFLRAEDFFGFAKRISQMRADLESDLAAVDMEYEGRSERAKGLARMPYARELHALSERYGMDLDARSHGESFLTLFQSRFVPDGLYLLDEPEAPLSVLRQLGFLSLLKEMVDRDAQFIIATHSPILMAFPGATILSFDQIPVRPVPWDELEHVTITRAFLNDPGAFLTHL
jgi:predicted ATPase